jgi:octaprenyl-diphosphate synthase
MPAALQPLNSNGSTAAHHELLESLYGPIAQELAEVEALLKKEMRSQYPFVDELVRYGCLLGGKRLRPALLLLTAKAIGGRVTREHITLAAVVEMIHTATLVHDDVLDEADLRRHLATVNARWDSEASVLLGDFLFTHAFYLAATLDSALGCRLIGQATNRVCEGELRQKGTRGNFLLSEAEYLDILEAKTGALTAVSCRLGALFAGADEAVVEQMDRFGRNLGIAFQIADDLLDVIGEEEATGKSLGTDLEKQKPTLPVIRALQLATSADQRAILSILNAEDASLSQLMSYLKRHSALEFARRRAVEYADSAKHALTGLETSAARRALEAMTDFVVHRPI